MANPILRNTLVKATGETLTLDELRANAPTLQMQDVIEKTAISLAIIMVGAVFGWNSQGAGMLIGLPLAILLGFINALSRRVHPILVTAWSAAEGLFLGSVSQGISAAYSYRGENLAGQAVLGTLLVFTVMLTLYTKKVIQVTDTFRTVMMSVLLTYMLLGIGSLIAAFLGVGHGWGFYGSGLLGIGLCLIGVLVAALTLALDFANIAQAVTRQVPKEESWRLAFGLNSTLVWMYIEMLRLLSILAGSRR